MNKLLYPILSFALLSATANAADTFTLKLVDQLDEPESYCLDVTGWGDHLKIDDPLQVHTCKAKSPDQIFEVAGNALKMPEYNRCLTATASGDSALAGSALILRECDGSKVQHFTLHSSGKIMMDDSSLCVASGKESQEASGPSHLWRVASLQSCDSYDQKLMTWKAE
ncbi:RICIN domain-containing protein [Vibrio aphrogenes]|uniref:RICIN domain-containing protein n=1 Tax=Vibrio aphrogenes TaxID=1891186 RepID=UPI000B357845|nr:RICIN domain-containing protein [Vibrio aphrogenes]